MIAAVGLWIVGMVYSMRAPLARQAASNASGSMPWRSIATGFSDNRCRLASARVPDQVSSSTSTTSPGSVSPISAAAMPCSAPLVSMTRSGSTSSPRRPIHAAPATRCSQRPVWSW